MQLPSSYSGHKAAIDAAAIATRVVESLRNGRFAEIERFFAPPLRAVVSAETLRIGWELELDKCGLVSAIGEPVREPVKEGLIRVSVPVTCERGTLTVVMSVDGAGVLQGLRISSEAATSWAPPPYAIPKRFDEREVTIGS